jgi:hypothetical protein
LRPLARRNECVTQSSDAYGICSLAVSTIRAHDTTPAPTGEVMKTVKLTSSQYALLQALGPRELRSLRKHPHVVREAKHLVKACKKIIKVIEALDQFSNARKRATAHKRIIKICTKAIERSGI